jgi:hypothetical protein
MGEMSKQSAKTRELSLSGSYFLCKKKNIVLLGAAWSKKNVTEGVRGDH